MNDTSLNLSADSLPVLAYIAGEPLTIIPTDLFIPPDALEILLDSFSGPLDLLLYLIRKQNIDIFDIPIAEITQQYMHYIQLIEEHRLELAFDYLVMAAMLAEIKSRLLLPPIKGLEEVVEEDPRMELVRKLQAYEEIKKAALMLDELPRLNRDFFWFSLASPKQLEPVANQPKVDLISLTEAMRELIKRQSHLAHHQITREPISIRERMSLILNHLALEKTLLFTQLIEFTEGRLGLTISFLAILELARLSLISITQTSAYATIYLQAVEHD